MDKITVNFTDFLKQNWHKTTIEVLTGQPVEVLREYGTSYFTVKFKKPMEVDIAINIIKLIYKAIEEKDLTYSVEIKKQLKGYV